MPATDFFYGLRRRRSWRHVRGCARGRFGIPNWSNLSRRGIGLRLCGQTPEISWVHMAAMLAVVKSFCTYLELLPKEISLDSIKSFTLQSSRGLSRLTRYYSREKDEFTTDWNQYPPCTGLTRCTGVPRIRNNPPVGPYSSPMPRDLRGS